MVGRQAGLCKVVGIFILNGIHFSHKQKKKETHFDYNAEDDTTEQWFTNVLLLWTPFTAPRASAVPFVF